MFVINGFEERTKTKYVATWQQQAAVAMGRAFGIGMSWWQGRGHLRQRSGVSVGIGPAVDRRWYRIQCKSLCACANGGRPKSRCRQQVLPSAPGVPSRTGRVGGSTSAISARFELPERSSRRSVHPASCLIATIMGGGWSLSASVLIFINLGAPLVLFLDLSFRQRMQIASHPSCTRRYRTLQQVRR